MLYIYIYMVVPCPENQLIHIKLCKYFLFNIGLCIQATYMFCVN